MKDLIKALQILTKYSPAADFQSGHDTWHYCAVEPGDISTKDLKALSKLGFEVGDPHDWGTDYLYSYQFGSC